jgi:hypothetical protein
MSSLLIAVISHAMQYWIRQYVVLTSVMELKSVVQSI